MANPSGIEPTEYRVLVKPDPVQEKTKGGIILTEETREKEQYASQEGTLIAVSPIAFTYHDPWPDDARKPQPGDRVIFARYAGTKRTGKDGQDYRLINDRDVTAVLT
jgi:chaperonin GroES